MLEERLLLWKLKHGDKDALCTVYEKYKDDLRTIAGSMLRDTCIAEDILHDVFVSFAEKVGQLQIKGSLKNYLTTCIINRVRDEFRRTKPNMIELDKAEPISSRLSSSDSRIIADERLRLLTDALVSIPFEQREVVVLHLKGGMKFREIARMQKTSLSTVCGRYRYGLKKLKLFFNGEHKNESH
jgi:RNA polymerase sigma-70 factor (ECF subfamily)